jgi:hypothetical protein
MKKIIPILTILFLLFSAVPLTADAGIVQCGIENNAGVIENPCGFCDIFKLINNIVIFFLVPSPAVNGGFAVVPLIATLLILAGGFYILIAAGRPNMQSQGKSIITAVVIGLLMVYSAWVIVNSILTFLGVAQWTGLTDNPATTGEIEGWWQIQCK